MSLLTTIECFDTFWIADRDFNGSERHARIIAGAHQKRVPYCRKHLNSLHQGKEYPLPKLFVDMLLEKNFDLDPDSDLVVVQHDLAQDPVDQLEELHLYGREILSAITEYVPDSAFLGKFTLSPCEKDDLRMASDARRMKMFDLHKDSPQGFKELQI